MPDAEDRFVRGLIAAAGCAAAIAVVVVVTGGGAIELGGLVLRSHDPVRPLIAAVVLSLLAVSRGTARATAALEWQWQLIQRAAGVAALVLSIGAVAAGIRWGAFVAGGSDSYCYLNQAELLARGAVHDFEPLSADPGWPGNAWSFAPAGHIPIGSTSPALVPICPAGYPLLMAGARRAIGRQAMFWITPLMGGLAVGLAFLIGRRLAGPAAGLLTAVLTLASPSFLMQLFQPMNDVTATAAWAAVLAVAMHDRRTTASTPEFQLPTPKPIGTPNLQRDRSRAAVSGLLTGLALTVRPNLLPLALVVGLGLALVPASRTLRDRVWMIVVFGLAALPGVGLVMAIQNAMYGSPFKSGYGDLATMFSISHLGPNLQRYPRWLIEVHTPIVAAAVAAPWVLSGHARRCAIWLLVFIAATLACYLPYVVFDAWWYTRFLLPAIPPILALTAAVTVKLIDRIPAAARAMVFGLLACALVGLSIRTAIPRDVFRIRDLEWRFRSAGERVARLPASAALITLHHSGSVRFYAGRPTLGWADIEQGRLEDALSFLRRHGRTPYLMFEPWEEPQFRERFAGDRLGALDWPPLAEVDGVRIYDPDDFDRHRRGEPIATERVVTARP